MSQQKKIAYAWLQLLRAPNLLTVPGDPLAGLFLAAGAQHPLTAAVLMCPVAAVLFYAFGLLLNDYCDIEVDRSERPERPLPAGLIKPRTTLATAMGLAIAGFAICALINMAVLLVAVLLVLAICAYNLKFKRISVLGALTMGSCRALSLLLGAAAIGVNGLSKGIVWIAAAGILVYVASITAIAARESERIALGVKRWFPAAAVALLAILLAWAYKDGLWWQSRSSMLAYLLLLLPQLVALHVGVVLRGKPAPESVSRSVGRLIMGLLPLQAALTLFSGQPTAPLIAAALILLLWPVSMILGRLFYAS